MLLLSLPGGHELLFRIILHPTICITNMQKLNLIKIQMPRLIQIIHGVSLSLSNGKDQIPAIEMNLNKLDIIALLI